MKKIFWCVLILILILIKIMGAGAECLERWIFDPRVEVYVVDRVDEESRYSVYYCIADTYVITLERDVGRDFGWITEHKDVYGETVLCYETDWGDMNQAKKIINRLVSEALISLEEAA